MQNRLERPLAVVTGASAGIGAALTRELAARAYRVLAVARRAERLEALQQETQGAVIPCVEDLVSDGAVDRITQRVEALGGAELLVNNAGLGAFARFVDTPAELIAKQVRLNALVSVELTHRLLPAMIANKAGGVLVVTSTGGFYPTPKLAVYGGTKAFLLSFTEALSEELRGTGVHTLAVCPGATASEFGEVAGMQAVMEKTPLMSPEAVAKAALRAWDQRAVICVPGLSNKVMVQAAQWLPRALTRRAMAALLG
ncbi:MAG: SDR family oxidoreductase [Myxococcales bacterium]